MKRNRRRRYVLERVPTQKPGDRIYTLVFGRFVLERRAGKPVWLVSDTYAELDFSDLSEETRRNLHKAKNAVVKRYRALETKRTAERRRKRGILSWREKVVLTRKGVLPGVA